MIFSVVEVRLGTLPWESFAIEIDSIGLQLLNLKPKMNLWCNRLGSGNMKSYVSQKKTLPGNSLYKECFRESESFIILQSLYKKRCTISDQS